MAHKRSLTSLTHRRDRGARAGGRRRHRRRLESEDARLRARRRRRCRSCRRRHHRLYGHRQEVDPRLALRSRPLLRRRGRGRRRVRPHARHREHHRTGRRRARHRRGRVLHSERRLEEHRSDLLFSAELAGDPVLLYLLFEHRSTSEPLTAFQLLGYTVDILRDWLRANPGAERLPAADTLLRLLRVKFGPIGEPAIHRIRAASIERGATSRRAHDESPRLRQRLPHPHPHRRLLQIRHDRSASGAARDIRAERARDRGAHPRRGAMRGTGRPLTRPAWRRARRSLR